jgi:hypothetical protein
MEKQIQKAGNKSQQIQAGTVILGIDEKRVREIIDEKIYIVIKELSEEASVIALERIKKFEDNLISKIVNLEDGLKSFEDPNFQLNLIEAQKSAAGTECLADYDLLSELLIHRIKKGKNREKRTAIKKAIEIVGDISDEALMGLTLVHSVGRLKPTTGNISEGLDLLNEIYGKLMCDTLPIGSNWIDNLEILDTIRINQQNKFTDITTFIGNSVLTGYTDVGIKINSDAYRQASETLRANNLPIFGNLVVHFLNPNYLRLDLPNIDSINSTSAVIITEDGVSVFNKLTEQQRHTIKSVYNLYEENDEIKIQIMNSFKREWKLRPNLNKLENWWNKLPYYFDITSVGKVLAYANVQRYLPGLPPLD